MTAFVEDLGADFQLMLMVAGWNNEQEMRRAGGAAGT